MKRKSIVKLVIFSAVIIGIVTYVAVTRSKKKNEKVEKYMKLENNTPRVVVGDSDEVKNEDAGRSKYDNKDRPRVGPSDDDINDNIKNPVYVVHQPNNTEVNKPNNTEVKGDSEESLSTTTTTTTTPLPLKEV